MPSLASIANSSSSQSTSWTVTSGSALTKSGLLKLLSPRLLETARPIVPPVRRFCGRMHRQVPWTSTTEPPSSSMRFFSLGKFGLWSSLSRLAVPSTLPSTARESPQLAMKRRNRICSSGPKTVIVQAVLPEKSCTRRACCKKLCSVCLKPPSSAVVNAVSSLAVLVRSRSLASTFFAKCVDANSAQPCPPWPSKTPKKKHIAVSPRTLMGSFAFITEKSSH
mmetsp:Transcript_106458/g.237630  ORF Transcript_106458/g.237630 Transcript_106458/m.237630 type:complete len:222 (+) Transcript_106458:436-1101(+)